MDIDTLPFFALHFSQSGLEAVSALTAPGRVTADRLEFHLFDDEREMWEAAPNHQPVGCLLEVANGGDAQSALRTEDIAERMDAFGVSVFLFHVENTLPTRWAQSPLLQNYHLLDLSVLGEPNLRLCEETIIGHLHFARFANERDVQVYQPSAIKFLRSRQRLEQECFVMSAAEHSPERSRLFVKLLARHSCPDIQAIEVERLDATVDDLINSKGITFSDDLPVYIVARALEALSFLHDWRDIGIHTFGDFRKFVGLPWRQVIPGSVYFRHFRHVAHNDLEAMPFQIIHCDIKPGNFLLKLSDAAIEKIEKGAGELTPPEVPEVKMFDFDLCRYRQHQPGSKGSEDGPTYCGTYGYTAPELFLVEGDYDIDVSEERCITPLVDFYAIGTLFYELIAREELIPRPIAKVGEDEYYGTITDYRESGDFRERLSRIHNSGHRAFIDACTKTRQEDRSQALQNLAGKEINAETLKLFCTNSL
ncbi:MAG: hypothetical protein QGF00_14145 [Planctomycetota bacterium]|nr:hypothetical protein [Planctomycetota bacterium]